MMKTKSIIIVIVLIAYFLGCNAQNEKNEANFPELKGPYLGQKPPGMTPEIFAPGIISNPDIKEFSITFSPNGEELFFYRLYENYDAKIFYCRVVDGKWTAPEEFLVTAEYPSFIPCFTNDENILYFNWRRPSPNGNLNEASMWFTERTVNGWSEPQYAGKAMYLTSTRDGQLYTGIRNSENGDCISKITIENGVFIDYKKQNILPLNGEQSHPCIAPNGSYILFDQGGDHLSVSFKMKDGTWGETINLWEHGFDPIAGIARISPDGKYLFFKQGVESNRDIFWVSAKIIENLKPKDL